MGACCDPSDGAQQMAERSTNMYEAPKEDEVVDLPLPNTFGETDKYRLFECSSPFPRIDVNTFCVWVKMAHTDCGEEGYVTLKSLRSRFKSPAWKDLEDENSDFAKFLLSSAFKNDEKVLRLIRSASQP